MLNPKVLDLVITKKIIIYKEGRILSVGILYKFIITLGVLIYKYSF